MTLTEALKLDGRKKMPLLDTEYFPSVKRSYLKCLTVSVVRNAVVRFATTGISKHSSNRLLLGYLVAYCEENFLSYTIEAALAEGRRLGYSIKLNVEKQQHYGKLIRQEAE